MAQSETMATYFIRRLRESQQERFRWAPQPSTASAVLLKPGDYREDGEVVADSPYQAWQILRQSNLDLRVGDALMEENGTVHLCRYSGFEAAEWMVTDKEQQVSDAATVSMQGDQGG